MKKLLILSGKGGTGKTTTAAAFTRFAKARAIADCDVDAPNLHIVTSMKTQPRRSAFLGGDKAAIDPDLCIGCGLCSQHCRFGAIRTLDVRCEVDEVACEGCGVCEYVCPQKAVSLHQDEAGEVSLWQEDTTFVTATLKMGRGNSGKLVTEVKNTLNKHADAELALIDGSPGIGCPVIASVSGVDLVLIVAEPSMSGISDMERIVKTASGLRAHVAVCVNKWDASPESAQAIEAYCAEQKLPFVGRIPYDKKASQAINGGKSVADFDCPARDALYSVYQKTMQVLEELP